MRSKVAESSRPVQSLIGKYLPKIALMQNLLLFRYRQYEAGLMPISQGEAELLSALFQVKAEYLQASCRQLELLVGANELLKLKDQRIAELTKALKRKIKSRPDQTCPLKPIPTSRWRGLGRLHRRLVSFSPLYSTMASERDWSISFRIMFLIIALAALSSSIRLRLSTLP